MPTIEGRTVEARGAVLGWAEHGAGRPLVLLNGQAMDGRLWRPVLPTLSGRYRLIVPSWRGIGSSSAVFPQPWTTRELAEDVVSVLDAAGVETARVWGFSLGGRAAQWLAAEHPERVDALVLSGTTPGDRTGTPRDPEVTSQLVRAQRTGLAELFFTQKFLVQNPDMADAAAPASTDPAALGAHYRASRDHDGADALPRIQAPTLVTHGGHDRISPPANGRLLAERIAGARLRLAPTGRHAAHVESPATLAAVLRFLREVELDRPATPSARSVVR